MGFSLSVDDYVDYLLRAARKIAEGREYITALDAATGDGDHWANINLGFESIVAEEAQLRAMSFDQLFKRIGLLMMSKVGGSSGLLYGSAFMAAARGAGATHALSDEGLCQALGAMLEEIMKRGQSAPGHKTMIDALHPAVEALRQAIAGGADAETTLNSVRQAALDGAEATLHMEAIKGRATYQANKGVGHLDPGAVTMAWQIEALCDTLSAKLG